jgi:tRNA threonylcarbamoyladenosine biosynthesis protein TsaE
MMKKMAVFMTNSAEETKALGKNIGKFLEPGAILLLYGALGAGKTVLTQGIALGLGIEDMVTSPTYTLLHLYQGRLPLYHFDIYRLESPDELLDLGYEEFFYDEGVTVVEWPQRLGFLCPDEYVRIDIDVMDYDVQRKITITTVGKLYEKLERGLRTL